MTGGIARISHRASAAAADTIRPGLERIRAAFEMTGHPERAFRIVHIAGTNGKGSTASFLEAVLRRLVPGPVGLYTSPHLVSPEERIRVDGVKIPAEDLRRALRKAAELSRRMEPACNPPLSFFEEMTWAACRWFRKEKASLVVMEAGLGGRWDATNACLPSVSVITTVGIDHREWLGDTLGEIAAEKAEILRPGVPAVLGKLRRIPRGVVRRKAEEKGAPVWELGRDFLWEECGAGRLRISLPGVDVTGIRLGMAGEFQRDNAAIACAAAWRWASVQGAAPEDFASAAREGLASAKWPGRYSPLPERRNAGAWADGAHNPDAARVLSRELRVRKGGRKPVRIVALWSMLRDKDIGGFLRELSEAVDGWVVFPMEHERAASLEELAEACRKRGCPHRLSRDFAEGWTAARRWAGAGGMVIVCGSLAAVGEAYRHRVGEIQ
jgi:dihydrofolate synthase/folylpolyglutamate synthase